MRVAVPYVLKYNQVEGFLRFSINTWALYCDLMFVLAFETGCYDESVFQLQTVTNEENPPEFSAVYRPIQFFIDIIFPAALWPWG